MMIQRRRRRFPPTPDQTVGQHAVPADAALQHELLVQIAAGTRAFEASDGESNTFQKTVRSLEALAAAGLISIGKREMAAGAPRHVIAIRRIRLTEAGKRKTAPARSSDHGRNPDEPNA